MLLVKLVGFIVQAIVISPTFIGLKYSSKKRWYFKFDAMGQSSKTF